MNRDDEYDYLFKGLIIIKILKTSVILSGFFKWF